MKLLSILHPFVLNRRYHDQDETWGALEEIRKAGFRVAHYDCEGGDFEYDDFLASHWDINQDLIIVEMDVVPTVPVIKELAQCWEPFCMFGYSTHPQDGLQNDTVYALGCAKISLSIQRLTPLEDWYRKGTWHNLDQRIRKAISKRLAQGDGHYHGPPILKHNHPREVRT